MMNTATTAPPVHRTFRIFVAGLVVGLVALVVPATQPASAAVEPDAKAIFDAMQATRDAQGPNEPLVFNQYMSALSQDWVDTMAADGTLEAYDDEYGSGSLLRDVCDEAPTSDSATDVDYCEQTVARVPVTGTNDPAGEVVAAMAANPTAQSRFLGRLNNSTHVGIATVRDGDTMWVTAVYIECDDACYDRTAYANLFAHVSQVMLGYPYYIIWGSTNWDRAEAYAEDGFDPNDVMQFVFIINDYDEYTDQQYSYMTQVMLGRAYDSAIDEPSSNDFKTFKGLSDTDEWKALADTQDDQGYLFLAISQWLGRPGTAADYADYLADGRRIDRYIRFTWRDDPEWHEGRAKLIAEQMYGRPGSPLEIQQIVALIDSDVEHREADSLVREELVTTQAFLDAAQTFGYY